MVVNYNLVVDFARPSKSNTILIAEDDANSRNCRFTLLADKQPFDMTNVTTAVVQGILPSGSVIIDEATIEQDDDGNNINVVDYLVPNAFAETPGTITLTISLNDNLGARITSFEFYLKVRNALYNEDDYINDDDLDGFRDLLARSQAALEKMEQMTENDALPNPYPIRFEVDGVEYEYKGDELVEIYMGDVAYLGEVSGTVEITEDDSAAQQAIHAAEEAAESAQDCASKLDEMTEMYNTIDAMVPTANVQKDTENHLSTITITDRNGTTTAEVYDGITSVVNATATVDSNTGTPGVTVVKTGTDESPSFAFNFTNLKGEKGDPGSGIEVIDSLDSTSTGDPLSANMGRVLDGKVSDAQDAAHSLVEDTVGWTGKNLLPNKASSQTINGVTFTVNSDGSISANGTASARSVLSLFNYEDNVRPASGEYILSKGYSQTNIALVLDGFNGSTWVKTICSSGNTYDAVDADVDYDGYDRIRAYFLIENGTTVNNIIIYPMLRHASIANSTYEPYHESVKQVFNSYYTKSEVDDKMEVVVKYAGKKSFAELTNALLAETYENNFFMLSDNGYITSANINLWNDNFVVGDHVMTDSHIAVVKYNGSTAGKGTYVFDDFGGFVEVDEFTSLYSPVNGVVTFPNLNPSYGYKLFADIPDESSATWPTSASDLPHAPYTKIQRSTNADGTINLAYTVTNTSLQYALRIFK